jgi:RNA polymerase sigma factor (sigma-70 family)
MSERSAVLVVPTTQFEEAIMCRDAFDQRCPWTLLVKPGALVSPCQACHPQSDIACREGLNEHLEKYFASEQSRTASRRNCIFFNSYPLLLKILQRYCHPRADCHKNCVVGDLHSDMYVAFAEYLDQFDASRNVGFLSYIFKKLSWRAFNSFVREDRVRRREILWDEEREDGVEATWDSISLENSLIAALDLEKYLSRMQTQTRDLCLLHYCEGYSYNELAVMERRQATTIRKAVSRACREIREAYSFDPRHAFENASSVPYIPAAIP